VCNEKPFGGQYEFPFENIIASIDVECSRKGRHSRHKQTTINNNGREALRKWRQKLEAKIPEHATTGHTDSRTWHICPKNYGLHDGKEIKGFIE
jgi:hypothetical protein